MGLVHDVGKIMALYGEPQWAVVGDTFPVGCAFSNKCVFPEFFKDNPDSTDPVYRLVVPASLLVALFASPVMSLLNFLTFVCFSFVS